MHILLCHRDQRLGAFASLVLPQFETRSVTDACNLVEFETALVEQPIDSIVMHCSGVDDPFLAALTRLREEANDSRALIPVIVTMDGDSPELRVAAARAGADECVVLATDAEALIASFQLPVAPISAQSGKECSSAA
jgi:DNA-binding response OmpR family regulator